MGRRFEELLKAAVIKARCCCHQYKPAFRVINGGPQPHTPSLFHQDLFQSLSGSCLNDDSPNETLGWRPDAPCCHTKPSIRRGHK